MEEGYLALRWNNHDTAFKNFLQTLRKQEMYTDVSLACDKKLFPVHKFVLSTCSDAFKDIFSQISSKQNTVVFMKDIAARDLECILDFMYMGEVHIARSELGSLLRAAESLQVKGLAVQDDADDQKEPLPTPVKPKSSLSPLANKSLKRPILLDSSNGQHKRFKTENPSARKNNLNIQNIKKSDLNTLTVASPSSITEDVALMQIKKEITSDHESNFQEDTRDGVNGFADGELDSQDFEYFKSDYMGGSCDQSNFSFENSELSTAELLQVDINEDWENVLIGDEALREAAQVLSNTPEEMEVPKKPFSCNLCPNTFTRRDNLTNHIKTHFGDRPFRCNVCKKCFTRKDYLKQHEKIHTGEKPFKCPTCEKAFTRKEGLTDHMRCHSDFKEFSCDNCDLRFKQKCGLRFHKRNYHK